MPVELKPYPRKLPKTHDVFELELERREVRADGAAEDAAPEEEIWVTLSTETPVQRWFGTEVLGHEPAEVDLRDAKDGIPFYLEHGLSEFMPNPDLMIGSIRDIELRDKRMRGRLDFSSSARAQQAKQDVLDGHWRWGSVGRIRSKAKETKPPVKGGDAEARVVRWKPVEFSLVGVPADFKAKVDRNAGEQEYPVEFEGLGPEGKESKPMKKVRNEQNVVIEVPDDDPRPAVSDGPGGGGGGAEVRAANSDHAVAVLELCDSHKIEMSVARDMVKRGLTREQAGMEILERKSATPRTQPPSEVTTRLPKRDARRYSFNRAIQQALIMRHGGGKLEGLEYEVHQERVSHRSKEVEYNGGFMLPLRIDEEGTEPREVRAQTTFQAGKGLETVFDSPQELIEILAASAVVPRLGGQFMPGLTGNPAWPREGGDVTVYWVGENPAASVTRSDMDWEMIMGTPKTIQGEALLSRQLAMTSSIDVEQRNKNSFGRQTALAIDRIAFHGTGAGGQPMGIYNSPDVLSVAMGSVVPTWAKITDMLGAVADKNAELGTLGFATTAMMAARLKATLTAAAAGSDMIWSGKISDGEIGGYRAIGSSQLSKVLGAGADEHGFIFANWNDLIVCLFGNGIELIVDPYTLAGQAMLKITSFQMGDVVIRHPESFCVGTAAKLA